MIWFVCVFTEKRRDPPNGMSSTVFLSVTQWTEERCKRPVRPDGVCSVCQIGGVSGFLCYLCNNSRMYFFALTMWKLCGTQSLPYFMWNNPALINSKPNTDKTDHINKYQFDCTCYQLKQQKTMYSLTVINHKLTVQELGSTLSWLRPDLSCVVKCEAAWPGVGHSWKKLIVDGGRTAQQKVIISFLGKHLAL